MFVLAPTRMHTHTHAQTHTQTHAHTLTHTSVPHTHAFVARRRSIQRPLITRGSSDAPRDGHVVILVCAGPTTTSRQLHSPVKIQIPRHQLNNYLIIIFFSLYIQHFNVGTYYEIHIRRVIILLSTASARLYFWYVPNLCRNTRNSESTHIKISGILYGSNKLFIQ